MQVGLSNEVPPLPGIPDQTLSCRDTLIALNISPVDTTFTYAWFRTGSMDTIMGTGISISVPGNYWLRVTNTGNACTNTGFFTVFLDTVPPMVDAGIPPGVLNCSNPSLMLSGMAGPMGIGSLSLQWSALAGSPISDSGTLNPGISFPDTYVLRVTRPDNGCSAADSVTILFNDDYPIVMAGPDTVLTCAMPVIQLQGSVQTAGAAVQWRWTSSTGNIIGGASTATATINRPGPYHLEVTDLASGCMGIDSVNVTMDTIAPLIELIAPLGLSLSCAVDSVVLDVGTTQSTGAAIFSWRPLSGNGDLLWGNRVVLGTVGVYQVIAVQTTNGCSDTLNVQVSGNYERPELNLTVSGLLNCITDTVQLQANTAVIPGADGALWRLPSGDSLLGTALSLPVSEPGAYRLRLINPENGCATESGVSVGADFIPPVAQILSPDTINCLRPQVALSSAGSYGRGMLRYQWVGPAGGGLIFPDTLSVASAMRSGLYTLMLTDEINGCKDTAFAEVIALANPITALEASLVSPSCYGEADGAINILQVFGGSPPYQYRFNQGSLSARTAYDQLIPGQYPIRILDASGCSLDTTLYLPETPLLVVELGEDTILSLGESIRLVAQPNRPVQQYRWWPAGGGIVQDAAEQLLTPLFEETYRVIVTDDRGCTATDWVNVQINKEKLFFMPGAFSPNGDGINDYVEVFTGKGIASVQSLSVYDRWGNLLFNRKDYLSGEPVLGWDGYFRGMPMKPGVYVVHAVLQRIDGQQEVYSGELLLLR
jgi:gliding motility-associated-like protein